MQGPRRKNKAGCLENFEFVSDLPYAWAMQLIYLVKQNMLPGEKKREANVYSGLSGLQLNIPQNKYPPPFEKASRLSFYASLFNSIEINSSFYKIPQAATVSKWSSQVSDKFRFTFKLWKEITHNKGLNFNKEDVSAFINSINPVQQNKGCLLIQLPPSLGRESVGMCELCNIIP